MKVEADDYSNIINKLLHNIRAKMDGDRTPKEGIFEPAAQDNLCVFVDHIISNIQAYDFFLIPDEKIITTNLTQFYFFSDSQFRCFV